MQQLEFTLLDGRVNIKDVSTPLKVGQTNLSFNRGAMFFELATDPDGDTTKDSLTISGDRIQRVSFRADEVTVPSGHADFSTLKPALEAICFFDPASASSSVVSGGYVDIKNLQDTGALTDGFVFIDDRYQGLLMPVSNGKVATHGTGSFMNCDWQGTGDYSGVLAFAGVAGTGNQYGIWNPDVEDFLITISSVTGTFAIGDIVTDTTTLWTGVILDVLGADLQVYSTNNSAIPIATNTIENGTLTASATIDSVGATNILDGDVVAWCDSFDHHHYVVIDNTKINGNNPAGNTDAYLLLPKTQSGFGYQIVSNAIGFDINNDWLFLRDDNSNTFQYDQFSDSIFGAGQTIIGLMAWGHPSVLENRIYNAYWNFENFIGAFCATNRLEALSFMGFQAERESIVAFNHTHGQAILGGTIGRGSNVSSITVYESANVGVTLGEETEFIGCEIYAGVEWYNKTIEDSTSFLNNSISGTNTTVETVSKSGERPVSFYEEQREITVAELSTIGTVNIQLNAVDVGTDEYISDLVVSFAYKHNTTAWTYGTNLQLKLDGISLGNITSSLITSGADRSSVPITPNVVVGTYQVVSPGSQIMLGAQSATDPSVAGDGKLVVFIKYKILKFPVI